MYLFQRDRSFHSISCRRHPGDVGRPHPESADDARFSLRQAVPGGDAAVGGEADLYARHPRCLATGKLYDMYQELLELLCVENKIWNSQTMQVSSLKKVKTVI